MIKPSVVILNYSDGVNIGFDYDISEIMKSLGYHRIIGCSGEDGTIIRFQTTPINKLVKSEGDYGDRYK